VVLDEGVVWAVVCEREEEDEPGVDPELEERCERGVFLGREAAGGSSADSSAEEFESSRPLG